MPYRVVDTGGIGRGYRSVSSPGGSSAGGGGALLGATLGNIAWLPFESDLVDATGNHTLSGNAAIGTVGGKSCLDCIGPLADIGNGDGKYLQSQENPPSNLDNNGTAVTLAFACYAPQQVTTLVNHVVHVGAGNSLRANFGWFWWYGAGGGMGIWQGANSAGAYTPVDATNRPEVAGYGEWHHQAFRFFNDSTLLSGWRAGPNTVEWYEDGVLRETVTMDSSEVANDDTRNRLWIGSNQNFYKASFGIRHLVIADSILDPADIATLSSQALA